jgi:hypothetical protein
MQIPADIRKCVVFLLSLEGGELIPRGTAFLVSVPSKIDPRFTSMYLVTARHVINRIAYADEGGKIRVRYNTKNGGVEVTAVDPKVWVGHPDVAEDVDIVIAPINPNFQIVDLISIPVSLFMDRDTMSDNSYGLGDDVFLTGLFSRRVGVARNIPIIRIGSIAALRDETIATDQGHLDAYVLEVRSSGGLSGSPVFAYIGPLRHGSQGVSLGSSSKYYLLGVVSGHWNHDSDIAPADDRQLDESETLNTGIAFAAPADKILEILEHPDLQALREQADDQIRSNASQPPGENDVSSETSP